MVLEIKISGDHFWIRDGCTIDNRRLHPEWPWDKFDPITVKNISRYPHNLLYGNVSIGHGIYEHGEPIDLPCKVCNKTYILNPEDLIEVEEAFQRLNKT